MFEIQETFKKYKDDSVFQKINGNYLSWDENETKQNNIHLERVVKNTLIPLMREDELFNDLYQRPMYGGSFYKKTKFGNPEEFDLDLILKLPVNYDYIQIDTVHENYGFIKIQINERIHQHPKWKIHERTLASWLTDDNYLNQNKFRSWFESVFSKAFRKLCYNLRNKYEIKQKKSGPAFTLIINASGSNINIDVDLVPCFEFNKVLDGGYRSHDNGKRKNWYAIPKPLHSDEMEGHLLWRLCFYDHEKDFLDGNLKDVIRMLKKFRNTVGWYNIASYYIETIFYNELQRHIDNGNQRTYLQGSKTGLFMHGLKKMLEALEKRHLPYFWHPQHNLLSNIHNSTLENYKNRLKKIISIIDSKIATNKYIIAHFVLEADESIDGLTVVRPESFYDEYSTEPPNDWNCNIL